MKQEKSLTSPVVGSARKAYTKPVVSQIRLVAEEAVLALCKWGTGASVRTACLPDRTCVSQRRS